VSAQDFLATTCEILGIDHAKKNDTPNGRPVSIVDAGVRKPLEVEVVIPVEDMGDLQAAPNPSPVPGAPIHRA